MNFAEALEHLHGLGPELPPLKPLAPPEDFTIPRRKFDLAHIRTLLHALGDPHTRVPAILIAGTNGKGSTAATLAAILTAAGYRTGLYTSPHLIRVTERIQLAHPTLPSEYGATISAGAAPGADGPLALSEIPEDVFAALYTQVEEAAQKLVHSGDLPFTPSFFERLTTIAFLFYAQREAEIMVLEVGLGGRLDATNVVHPILSILTDIALDHQEYLGDTISLIAAEKCGILRQNGTLITLPQLPEANHAIGLAATALHVHAINAADYIPAPTRSADLPPHHSPTGAGRLGPAGLAWGFSPTKDGQEDGGFSPGQSLPPNHYTLSLPTGEALEVASPLPGHHQQRNIALAIAAAVELRNPTNPNVSLSSRSEAEGSASVSSKPYPPMQETGHPEHSLARSLHKTQSKDPDEDHLTSIPSSFARESSNHFSYKISNPAIEAGIRKTHWPARLEFLPPNILLDVAHNPAGAWTLRAAIAALPPSQPRTLIFSCLRDKNLEQLSRILFPLFDASADADPLRRHDHLILTPIANPRAADVEHLLAAAHALGVPAHAAPHVAAALAQARQVTPANGLILATGSVYLVGEIRALVLTEPPE